jgi:hypothetical protein
MKIQGTNGTRLLINNLVKRRLGACCLMLSQPLCPMRTKMQEIGVGTKAKTKPLASQKSALRLKLRIIPTGCSVADGWSLNNAPARQSPLKLDP